MPCEPCKKRADQQAGRTYKCPKCHGSNTVPRYTLTFTARDNTGEARFFAYDDEAQMIIQKDCKSVMNPLGAKDELPQAIPNIVNKTFVLSVTLTDDSCKIMKKRQYQVKAVLERPTRRTSAQSTCMTQAQLVTVDGATHRLDQPGSSAIATASPQHQTDVLRIENAAQFTPAPAIHSDDDGSKDDSTRSRSLRTTARKNLFGQPDTTNKDTGEHGLEPPHDITAEDGANTDQSDKTLEPPPKRSKSAASKKSSKDGSHK